MIQRKELNERRYFAKPRSTKVPFAGEATCCGRYLLRRVPRHRQCNGSNWGALATGPWAVRSGMAPGWLRDGSGMAPGWLRDGESEVYSAPDEFRRHHIGQPHFVVALIEPNTRAVSLACLDLEGDRFCSLSAADLLSRHGVC